MDTVEAPRELETFLPPLGNISAAANAAASIGHHLARTVSKGCQTYSRKVLQLLWAVNVHVKAPCVAMLIGFGGRKSTSFPSFFFS